MGEFFHMISTFIWAATLFGVASVVALSLPKSRLRTVLSEFLGYAFMGLCAIYCISPIDLFPEAIAGPFGYIDDLGAVYAGYCGWQSGQIPRCVHQSRTE